MDVTDPEATEWLVSLTWPEQTGRMRTLNCALAVAARTPPTILAGTAQDHLADIVAETPDDQHLAFVFSWSIYQIFGSPGGRERLVDTLAELSQQRPLHEISIGHFGYDTPRMIMATHDRGVSRSDTVAHCDVYGTWLDWLATPPARLQRLTGGRPCRARSPGRSWPPLEPGPRWTRSPASCPRRCCPPGGRRSWSTWSTSCVRQGSRTSCS